MWVVLGVAVAVACGEGDGSGPDAGSGGAGGEDGTQPPPSGSAGEPPGEGGFPSGAGGAAGAAGASTGLGGEGGAGGERFGPAPRAVIRVCDDREVELDAELVRRAVVLSACLGGYTSDYLRYGLDGLAHHYSGDEIGVPWAVAEDLLLEACPQTLLGCNDVWACHQRLPVTTECDDGAVTRCEGQLAINCPQGKAIQDCEVTTGGEGECRVLGDGASARAQCVLSDECTGGTEKRCEGDWLVACHESGPEYGENCAERGLTCRDGRCAARAEPQSCTDLGQAACDGDRIRVCTSAGELYERDCSRLGEMTCKEDSGDRPEDAPWFDCVAEGCYAPFEYPDQCRGVDLMLALADGTRSPLHCPDYGFSTCSNGRCAP